MSINSLSVLFIVSPLSFIRVTLRGSPFAKSVLHTILPLPNKLLPIVPFELPFPVTKSISETADIDSIHIPLIAFYFLIFFKDTFVNLLFRN